jgi:inhibitor of KinA
MIEIKEFGDGALLINFEQKIDSSIHTLVKSYYHLLSDLEAVTYQIPAYCSITVVFDKNQTTFDKLKTTIEKLELDPNEVKFDSQVIEIPVCYENDFAPDIEELSKDLKLSVEEIISQHTSQTYDVYMMGFLPGFPYLGKLPKALECKRKSTPRKQVKAGSVGLAGSQTGIYPTAAPGGWQLIGQTPLKIFNPDEEEAFLIKMADRIKFKSISADDFKNIAQNGK